MSGVRVCVIGPVLALCCFSLLVAAQLLDPSEVAALRAIRHSLIDPLEILTSWNEGDPCKSSWIGVFCNTIIGSDGYLHVKELQMINMNLSGSLAPELGQLSEMKILDFMWNNISGNIPKEIGNITSLELLVLNGNQLSGSLPDEIGYLFNLNRLQIDQNHISGPIPKSFANLNKIKHFHMNNNSISGQLPPELSTLQSLVHFLVDSNNLSGYLPPEFSDIPNLRILQLDNNRFDGSEIPASYGNMSKLWKLSLRNSGLQGGVPDFSRIASLHYLDLSRNQLTGSIPSNKLSDNITTINLSNNNLNGSIPSNFSRLPNLQRLSLENNLLSGSVPYSIWHNMTFSATSRLTLDFQNNSLSDISGGLNLPANITLRLQGNPVCTNANQLNLIQFCGSETGGNDASGSSTNSSIDCLIQSCPVENFFEYVPASPVQCFCAAPLRVGYRLKSPCISDFPPYKESFEVYLTTALNLSLYQLFIDSFIWEEGPRLRMHLKFFPLYDSRTNTFNKSEVQRIRQMFTSWMLAGNDTFGPSELLNFTLTGPYSNLILESPKSRISKAAIAGIVLGAIACAIATSSFVAILIRRRHSRFGHTISGKHLLPKIPIRIEGLKGFGFGEMAIATASFNNSTQIGQGGYGKVYKGILADGTIVAIKRAQEGSLQGQKEFSTEIELLSRIHHRNLVSLVGYCVEEGEQMLIYEYMANGSLQDHLSGKSKEPLSFAMRLRIALDSAKGILYLHTEADPPIFHRDIKSNNILLDSKLTAKVADFGLSRLAPVPDGEGKVPGHVSTIVKGTPGYLDPEYFLTNKLTDKSDVYSLGIVFLELLTGMRPISHGKNIVREVNMAYQSGKMFSVVDRRMGSYPSECVEKFMAMALRCCKDEMEARPSMSEVVRELEKMQNMIEESNPESSGSFANYPGKSITPSSSTNTTRNPYVSSDVSGSDLVSGVFPSIMPR